VVVVVTPGGLVVVVVTPGRFVVVVVTTGGRVVVVVTGIVGGFVVVVVGGGVMTPFTVYRVPALWLGWQTAEIEWVPSAVPDGTLTTTDPLGAAGFDGIAPGAQVKSIRLQSTGVIFQEIVKLPPAGPPEELSASVKLRSGGGGCWIGGRTIVGCTMVGCTRCAEACVTGRSASVTTTIATTMPTTRLTVRTVTSLVRWNAPASNDSL
jgi:hypothetical protein